MDDDVIQRDCVRQQMYDFVATRIAKARTDTFSQLIDSAVVLGLGAIIECEWMIYLEMWIDWNVWVFIQETAPSLMEDFETQGNRISNVLHVLGGPETVTSAYEETAQELWHADYSQWPVVIEAMQSLRHVQGFTQSAVVELAPPAGRLLLSAIEVADLPFLASVCGPNRHRDRDSRRESATPHFVTSLDEFARAVVTAGTQGP